MLGTTHMLARIVCMQEQWYCARCAAEMEVQGEQWISRMEMARILGKQIKEPKPKQPALPRTATANAKRQGQKRRRKSREDIDSRDVDSSSSDGGASN